MLLAAGLLLPPLAADTHYLLLRELDSMTLNPLHGWNLVLSDNRVLGFYLLYTIAVALMLIWVLVSTTYLNYRSNMQQITPDIITPCADGQGQFGTARWMRQDELPGYYPIWKVPKKQKWFRQLMAAGKEFYAEVENSNVQIDTADD